MVTKRTMEKVWITWGVKIAAWFVMAIAFAARGCHMKGIDECTPGWWPWWMTVFWWTIVVTGVGLALVHIWACEEN